MAYSTDILDTRVEFYGRTESAQVYGYGMHSNAYAKEGEMWCNWKWTKGVKAMREGTLDAYDTILVRCRYNSRLVRDCRLKKDGVFYQILSMQSDKKADEMQLVVAEVTGT